jgi:hypothetical protein
MVLKYSFVLLTFCGPWVALVGQTAPVRAAQATVSSPPATQKKLPSQIVQPSLDVLKQALSDLTVDRWKASGVIKTEAETNVASMKRDLDATLPGLLATADAAPDSASKVLPAYRNVDALYDVLLRVTIAGRLAGAGQQSSELDQALSRVDEGRRALGDGLQDIADGQDKRLSDVRAALKVAQTTPTQPATPATPVCPAPAVKKKPVKPAVKPSTPAPS